MRTMGQNPEWSIVTELKKQYDVSSVAADTEIPTDLDVLLVAQPSSLTQKQIDNLTAYVKRGGPTLLFLDPLPVENPSIAPEVPRHAARRPVRRRSASRAEGRSEAVARPARARLADDRDRLEPVQPAPAAARPAAGGRLHRPGQRRRRTRSTRTTSSRRACKRSSPSSPACSGPRGARVPSSRPLLRTNAEGGTLPCDEATRAGCSAGMTAQPEPAATSRRARPTRSPPTSKGDAAGRRRLEPDKEKAKKPSAEAAEDPRDRDRRPRPDLRGVLRAPAAEGREPRARQRDVRAQLRRRAGRRRRVRRPPQAPAQAPDARPASRAQTKQFVDQFQARDEGRRGRGQRPARRSPRRTSTRRSTAVAPARTSTSGPRRSCSRNLRGGRQPPPRSPEGEHRGQEAADDPRKQGRERAEHPARSATASGGWPCSSSRCPRSLLGLLVFGFRDPPRELRREPEPARLSDVNSRRDRGYEAVPIVKPRFTRNDDDTRVCGKPWSSSSSRSCSPARRSCSCPTGPASNVASTTRASPSSPTSRTRSPAPTWRSSTSTASTASARQFKVMFKDGKWVIPSHHNYPADAKDRLAKTAGGRDGPDQGHDPLRQRRGPRGARRARPARPEGRVCKGRGKRVTLRDKSEKVLADFIIGKEVARPARPALRPRARSEADLRRQRQGRPLDPVRRLDRDQPA